MRPAVLVLCVLAAIEARAAATDSTYTPPDSTLVARTPAWTLHEMALVPGGLFAMGAQGENADERPAHDVHLDSFFIDLREVTVAQYRACRKDGGCYPNPRIGGGCNWWKPRREHHPINCMDWSEAERYCRWAGLRLPTEAEWEKAARGTDGRAYPWGGVAPDCGRAVFRSQGTGCGRNKTWDVGSKPFGHSPYGAFDMAGNVGEWVQDWYGEAYYAQSPAADPPGPTEGTHRVFRGGSWKSPPGFLRTTHRFRGLAVVRFDDVGFRCARDLR